MEIGQAVRKLLEIVEALHNQYPIKRFTLDGRLVGDLGEVLVEQDYDLELYRSLVPYYDGESSNGKKVQIKATMKDSLTFPCDHTPDFYLGIKILPDGSYKEVFNGPGEIVRNKLSKRKRTKNNLHSIKISALNLLNKDVPACERIPRKQQL